ncbi:rho GTPase-activating protein 29-like isoform X2 [Anoplophora glabripennis]|uniref:rho GTPase-activating protein 29-like isoform X2 n=1 Tax=Anoplophora glabripennis TaxID=217634 RepID=UPI00087588A2|nr:rho GTPase-activating protein 29-like isoform X2 [Anoplophora glabripennis]
MLEIDTRLPDNLRLELEDLLKSFNQIKNEKSEQPNNPKFPISENDEVEDDVQVRRNQTINAYRFSKTTDFDFGRKWTSNSRDFEVKGLTKMFISSETSPIKLKRTDTLKFQNGNFYKVDDSSKKLIKSNVTLKSARLLNRKDVDLRDANNFSYILFFDSSKDAKLFLESDKIRCYNENDNKSTITKTLLRLLGKRSSRELLERKGIYQNEPIFGNTLRNIYNTEKGVPRFIITTMELIERPENITSLGIYRTSGNLATIQKIRFEVDKGRLGILNEYCKDVDVLTGCLKLFFRELKEPLIPCDVCDSLLSATKSDKKYSKKDRGHIRQIISKLPEANSETLYVLIKHLIEVVKYKEENKMDTYNLSVCWGPTIIFMADPTPTAHTKDPMAQTADAARAFDALLTFYIDHPEELDFGRNVHDYLDSNRNPIQRHDSKESVRSVDSNTSKSQKKSGSNSSLNVDEVLKKSIELIEANINTEGLYKRSGSSEKVNKIVKKMMKKKVGELERHKFDPNDLTDSLKKYLKDLPEPLVTQECVEQVNKFCDNTPCLEPNNRQRIASVVEGLPKKDTFVYLLRHIIRVMRHEHQHNVSRTDMISIWTYVLNYQNKVIDSNEKFTSFLKAALNVFDETKPDAVPSPKTFSNGLLNDLRNYQKDKDRVSKYDNVPDAEGSTLREATILEEKTEEAEYTKL